MNPWQPLASAHATTSSSEAPGRPMRMLFITVSSNR